MRIIQSFHYIPFQGNLEKYLRQNSEEFKDQDNLASKVLKSSGTFSGRSLLKFCYQVLRLSQLQL